MEDNKRWVESTVILYRDSAICIIHHLPFRVAFFRVAIAISPRQAESITFELLESIYQRKEVLEEIEKNLMRSDSRMITNLTNNCVFIIFYQCI